MLYKENKSKTKAKQKQNKSKTKAKQKQNHQHNSILTTMHDLSDISYIFFAFIVGIPTPRNTYV
jgi:hypothetical protein